MNLYSRKLLFCFLLLKCTLFGLDNSFADNINHILALILDKNMPSINYISKRHLQTESEKMMLSSNLSFTNSSSVKYSNNKEYSIPISNQMNYKNFIMDLTVDPFLKESMISGSFYIPIINPLTGKIKVLHDLILLEKEKAKIEIEKIVFDDFKQLFTRLIELERISNEITMRKTMKANVDSMYIYLAHYRESGLVPGRTFTDFQFAVKDNIIQIAFSEKKYSILSNEISDVWNIDSTEISTYVCLLDSLKDIYFSDTCTIRSKTYGHRIDSIGTHILQSQIEKNYCSDNKFLIGPSFSVDSNFDKVNYGVSARVQINLKPKALSLKVKNSRFTAVTHFSRPDSSLILQSEEYVNDLENHLTVLIEELQIGNMRSMNSIPDLFNKMISQQLNLILIEYLSLTQFFSLACSFNDLRINFDSFYQSKSGLFQ